MSGRSDTPMRTSFAVKNGAALKFGSSATLRSLATRLRENTDRRRSPNVTLRPNALLSWRSIAGRNVLASTKRGTAAAIATTTTMTISRIFAQRFTAKPTQENFEAQNSLETRIIRDGGGD